MKLINIVFTSAVRVDGKMVDKAPEGRVFDAGILVPQASGAVLVPWHVVRYADVVEEAKPRAKKGAEPVA
jgi:hypothetical protein